MYVCIFPKTSTVLDFYAVFQIVMSFSYSPLFSPFYSSPIPLSLFNLSILSYAVFSLPLEISCCLLVSN